MSKELVSNYSDICRLMRDEISKCDLRITQTEENTKRLSRTEGIRISSINSVKYCEIVIDSLKPLIADTQDFITDKREDSKAALANALRLAGEIIPDSMRGIEFKMLGDEAWLETPDGAYADRAEGSGYKGTSSVFLRSVVMGANPSIIQTMMLDEPLSKVSTEHSAQLSTYLPIMAQRQQVILIEQKKEVFANIDCPKYGFFKSENFTTVVKE